TAAWRNLSLGHIRHQRLGRIRHRCVRGAGDEPRHRFDLRRLALCRHRHPWQLHHGLVLQPADTGADPRRRAFARDRQCRRLAGALPGRGFRRLLAGAGAAMTEQNAPMDEKAASPGSVAPEQAAAPSAKQTWRSDTVPLYAAIAAGSIIGSLLRWLASLSMHAVA